MMPHPLPATQPLLETTFDNGSGDLAAQDRKLIQDSDSPCTLQLFARCCLCAGADGRTRLERLLDSCIATPDTQAVVNTHCPVEAALLTCLTQPTLVARAALLAASSHISHSWSTTNPLASFPRAALLQQLQLLAEAHESLDAAGRAEHCEALVGAWCARAPLAGPPQSLMLLLHVRLQLLQRLAAVAHGHQWLGPSSVKLQLRSMQVLLHGRGVGDSEGIRIGVDDARGGYLAPASYVLKDIKQQQAGDKHVQLAVHTASLRLHAVQAACLRASGDSTRAAHHLAALSTECASLPTLLGGADPARGTTAHGYAGADAALAYGAAQLQLHAHDPTSGMHVQAAFRAFSAVAAQHKGEGGDDQLAALYCGAALQMARLCLHVLGRDGGCVLDVGGAPAHVAATSILSAMQYADGAAVL